jgi:hypothetical protein
MQIRFWTKAFIPKSVYNLEGKEITVELNDKDEKNISVIPLQSYFSFLTPFYGTDNRYFSDLPSPNDSARMTTLITIPDNENEQIEFNCYSDPTRQITKSRQALFAYPYQDPLGGINIGWDSIATEYPIGEQTIISRSNNHTALSFTMMGSNPFFTYAGVNFSPPIKMHFKFFVKTKDNGDIDVSLKGKTSQFPAFEAYIQINQEAPITLFRSTPQKGKTPFHLLYGASETVEMHQTLIRSKK